MKLSQLTKLFIMFISSSMQILNIFGTREDSQFELQNLSSFWIIRKCLYTELGPAQCYSARTAAAAPRARRHSLIPRCHYRRRKQILFLLPWSRTLLSALAFAPAPPVPPVDAPPCWSCATVPKLQEPLSTGGPLQVESPRRSAPKRRCRPLSPPPSIPLVSASSGRSSA
jgi:hypothetical protein